MVHFDDSLETVLASDLSGEGARASAWRQLVDLIGRGRASPNPRAIAMLERIRDSVPRTIRMASARDIEHAGPPASLVALLATDTIEVALPVLRSAELSVADWTALIPTLGPAARGVLRNRRDLPVAVRLAIDSFGPVDLVLGDDRADAEPVVEPQPVALPEPTADPQPVIEPQPVGKAEPVAPPKPPVEPQPLIDATDPIAGPDLAGPFSIVDVMARIVAFERIQDAVPAPRAPLPRHDQFRFETDATGMLRFVDGVSRAAVVGLSLALEGGPTIAGFDGVAAGALRRRTPFRDARLSVLGDSDAGGEWRVSGVPVFDPASGRFTGYRGTARRPRGDERAERAAPPATGVAQLRQLVHELRTPAGAIAGFAEMIEAQLLGPVSPVYRARAAAILDHSRELVAVIDDLDLAARIDGDALDLRADRVALGPLFQTIVADLTTLCELRGAVLEIEPTDVTVSGDRRAIERLLARLLATLVSASATGEALYVRMGMEGDGNVAIVFDRPAAFAAWPGDSVFDVDDSEEDASLLGTGFALRLARNLANELGGALLFGSATLTLRLPAVQGMEAGQVGRR
ncbi:histidine kinase dimerization/phospho-acceptor domain-containing protein [Sphingomonas sp. Leaf25]|uniref:histidine kinase dimerization/phospho-acceptor domain-containing protein n=1 Tax=Sphingomonas sp. Leaf25 TaxID=1735692 RepID=UPI0006F83EC8|nr:histidine kinase dimerization/phospho-acceptor domain-containing protein [Sphingomonas sp. Leaf25]KQM97537.1 hypothetical protein ASE78_09080 [Sphingomonas sp. Leaf25]